MIQSLDKMKYSVAMSVYKNDNPEHFLQALDSIIRQTIPPTEIILVVDGPVPKSIDTVITKMKEKFNNFETIRLVENKGHAVARQTGIDATHYELVGLMDSDDISVYDRFEKQLEIFQKNQNLDVLGGQIQEFIDSTENIVGIRKVPVDHSEIKKFLKRRCPFNQMTVMMKKSSMLKAGGYIDWYCEEDYYLWLRMFKEGCLFQNLPDNLVYVRVGKEMYQRRGGFKYFRSEAKLQKYMWKQKIITLPQYMLNVSIRFFVQLLLPYYIRGIVFQELFRERR